MTTADTIALAANVRIDYFDASGRHLDSAETHNATTQDWHGHILADIHAAESVDESITHLAFGDGDSEPGVSDDVLDNEVARFLLTSSDRDGPTLVLSAALTTADANGESLLELGLVTDEDPGESMLVNRALVPDPEGRLDPKTQDVQATVTVTLSAADVSEL